MTILTQAQFVRVGSIRWKLRQAKRGPAIRRLLSLARLKLRIRKRP